MAEVITKDLVLELISKHEIELKPTQNSLCIPIISRIYNKMLHELRFDDIKVCDGLIIDGHHRYISSLLAQKQHGTVPSLKTSATKVYDWNEVLFVENDWDTADKIEKLNRDDAAFNDLPVEVIRKMTH
ncbi:MAG: hypothetical protein GC178_17035 [Flavobacteriales bacterium]|nr:hypothetical protein [Flavobacteriales bacterium]